MKDPYLELKKIVGEVLTFKEKKIDNFFYPDRVRGQWRLD